MDIFLTMQHLRNTALPFHAYFGLRSMFGDENAKFVEFGIGSSLQQFWPLCSQFIAVNENRALVYSEASSEVWIQTMDVVLTECPSDAVTKIRWKPSKNGGRPMASPSATSTALAASRKQPKVRPSVFDFVTDVRLKGEVGKEDADVLRRIMQHACSNTGVLLRETGLGDLPKPGEFYHLASRDASAQPGYLRVLLRDQDEVRRVYAALHGQTVQVGSDQIIIEVGNDAFNVSQLSGNGYRGRP